MDPRARPRDDYATDPLGPLVAGLIVSAIVYGRRGVVDFLRRLVRGNVGLQWYLVAIGVPIALCAGQPQGSLCSPARPWRHSRCNWKELLERFLFIFLYDRTREEPGWRGFAIEHLQETRSPLAASLILAPLWTIWHLPLMGSEFTLPILPAFVISVFGGTFVLTWLYNRTRGSVLMTALMHAAINTIGAATVFRAFSGPASVRLWWIYSLLWLAAGAAVLLSPSRARVLVPKAL